MAIANDLTKHSCSSDRAPPGHLLPSGEGCKNAAVVRSLPMITLHAFSSMFPGGIGETKDMRVQWALEEMGLPYRVRAR